MGQDETGPLGQFPPSLVQGFQIPDLEGPQDSQPSQTAASDYDRMAAVIMNTTSNVSQKSHQKSSHSMLHSKKSLSTPNSNDLQLSKRSKRINSSIQEGYLSLTHELSSAMLRQENLWCLPMQIKDRYLVRQLQ